MKALAAEGNPSTQFHPYPLIPMNNMIETAKTKRPKKIMAIVLNLSKLTGPKYTLDKILCHEGQLFLGVKGAF